ncbi:hypothetical protein AWJ20_3045 [Sugiyamaella lignohabitans]|uniref:Transcriptional regulator n=1 Tax=Sugiyamaella lignohabitans TaxID=796027 RepID=A0A167FKL2_9ASCO|nr:uncharacterized protein AWJ20_3045 [Sugiyamaella lignohabitans]ANB15418.1 hypothetical protein AWJ20_3045 [Sugiyamaella lignohabitans]
MDHDKDEIVAALEEVTRVADINTSTVNSIRNTVVGQLSLDPSFFKSEPWKSISKSVVDKVVVSLRAKLEVTEGVVSSAPKVKPSKRFTEDNKTESRAKEKDHLSKQKEEAESSSEDENIQLIDESLPSKATKASSKLSPPPIKKRKHNKSPDPRGNTQVSSSDSQNKINTLKSQLLKCGVRRRWPTILDPLPNDKARIKFLTAQLHEIGMTGRFSLAKAKKIKEAREEALDLEDTIKEAQDFSTRGGRPTRA